MSSGRRGGGAPKLWVHILVFWTVKWKYRRVRVPLSFGQMGGMQHWYWDASILRSYGGRWAASGYLEQNGS